MTTFPNAAQPWLRSIPVMQQSVLFSAIRGPDGFRKHHPVKALLRFYRRCVLISAFDGVVIDNPYDEGGGSFAGPSVTRQYRGGSAFPDGHAYFYGDGFFATLDAAMVAVVSDFVHARDEMTLHYFAHAMHAFQILGYHHPDVWIRMFWLGVYERMVNALHLVPEPPEEMNRRLGDDKGDWALKADEAGSCSE